MPNLVKRILILLLFAAVLPMGMPSWTAFVGIPVALGQEDDPEIIEDQEAPPGIASGWIVGHRLLAEGNSADALPYLHMAYRAHPDVIVIAMDFQTALASEGYLRDALNVMDTLVAAYPDSQSFLLRRSALNLSSGNSDKALEDLRTIRRQGDASVEVLAAEASILASEGKTSQALDVLRDGLHLFPDRGRDIYFEMARILRLGDETQAIPELMDEALVEFPDEPMLWLVKIRALAALSLPTEARAVAEEADSHFAEALAASGWEDSDGSDLMESPPVSDPFPGLPNDSFAVELADYYAQNNQIDQALAILKPLSDRGELPLTPSLWLARLLLGVGREQEGVELVDRILTQWPASGRGWYLRGKIDEGRGEWDEAIPHYRRAVALDPYDPEIRLGVLRAMLIAWERDLRAATPDSAQEVKIVEFRDQAMIAAALISERDSEGQMLLGYSFRALHDLERAAWRFELAAENPDRRLTALIQKSICHDENGETAKARSALELLRREFPKDPEVANSFGYFLAEKGQDLDLAEDLIREALASDPGNGAYLDSLGWVLYRNGRFEDAFDYLIQAVNVLPDDPVILEHLGIVLMNLEQNAEALDVLERALNLGGDSERISALITTVKSNLKEKE